MGDRYDKQLKRYAARRARARRLRASGMTMVKIAKALGITPQRVGQLLKTA